MGVHATNPTLQKILKDIPERERGKKYQNFSNSDREASVNGADSGMKD